MTGEHQTHIDPEGTPITEGATVTAFWQGESFTAKVTAFKPPARFEGDAGRIVLTRGDGRETERYANQVTVRVPDGQDVPDPDPAASIESRAEYESLTETSEGHTYIRLSGRAGLQVVKEHESAQDARTRALCEELAALPGVEGVAVVATHSNRKRNIILHWRAGTDEVAVAQQAWRVVEHALVGIRLRRAFWQKEA